MARNVEVGVTVTADDKATPTLRGVGEAATSMASKAQGAFKGFMSTARDMNQTIELGMKAFRALSATVGDSIKKALEYRSANDPVVKQTEEFAKKIDIARARIGDAFLPALQGVTRALGPLIDRFMTWLNANRQIIATKIVENFSQIGRVLIDVVAAGALAAGKAWFGWLQIVDAIKISINKFYGSIINGAASVWEVLGKIPGIGVMYQKLADGARALGDEFTMSADNSSASLQKNIQDLDAFESKLADISGLAHSTINNIESIGLTAAQSIGIGGKATRDEIQKTSDAAKKAAEEAKRLQQEAFEVWKKQETEKLEQFGKSFSYQAELANRKADLDESIAKELERQQEENNAAQIKQSQEIEAQSRRYVDSATQFGAQIGESIAAFGLGIATQEEAMSAIVGSVFDMLSNLVMQSITMAAVEATAKAIAGHAGIPFVGIAIGAAAGAVASGLILALKSKIPKNMATGGIVPGIGNSDKVPAILQPGEMVIPAHQVRDAARGSGRNAANVTVNVQSATGALPTEAETRRFLRDRLVPELEELKKTGALANLFAT